MRSHIDPPWNDKRVEALIKQQVCEHQHLMNNYQKEMQVLRDSLKLALEKFDSLFQHCEEELKKKTTALNEQVFDLKNKVKSHEILSSDQSKTTLSLYQQVHDFHLAYVSKKELEILKDYYNNITSNQTKDNLNSLQIVQQQIKNEVNNIKEELEKFKDESNRIFKELNKKVDEHYVLLKMDKEGVLKEVRVFDKTIFIIEKKLENIYTLIDRINKRGKVCPKQD